MIDDDEDDVDVGGGGDGDEANEPYCQQDMAPESDPHRPRFVLLAKRVERTHSRSIRDRNPGAIAPHPHSRTSASECPLVHLFTMSGEIHSEMSGLVGGVQVPGGSIPRPCDEIETLFR